MTFYIKKPIAVEAYAWDGSIPFSPTRGFNPILTYNGILDRNEGKVSISTLEGYMGIAVGSYIVKGPGGEYWAVRKDVFENTYEEVNKDTGI